MQKCCNQYLELIQRDLTDLKPISASWKRSVRKLCIQILDWEYLLSTYQRNNLQSVRMQLRIRIIWDLPGNIIPTDSKQVSLIKMFLRHMHYKRISIHYKSNSHGFRCSCQVIHSHRSLTNELAERPQISHFTSLTLGLQSLDQIAHLVPSSTKTSYSFTTVPCAYPLQKEGGNSNDGSCLLGFVGKIMLFCPLCSLSPYLVINFLSHNSGLILECRSVK